MSSDTAPSAAVTVLLLYNDSVSWELHRFREGARTRHHFFGLMDIPETGLTVKYLHPQGWWARLVADPHVYKVFQAFWAVAQTWRHIGRATREPHAHRMVVVAVHEGAAYWPLLLKTVGLLRAPLVVVNVALLREVNLRGWRKVLWRVLLRRATVVVSYASSQVMPLRQRLGVPTTRSISMPFGIDIDFFALTNGLSERPLLAPANPYIISVGTNEGKDYPTLLDAVAGLPIDVLIVTDQYNIGRIMQHGLPDNVIYLPLTEMNVLRELYRHALFGVIPLGDYLFSSGQTVLLENMALGKAVIVADVPAIWDYVVDEENALLYSPGDSTDLRRQIQRILDDSDLREHIGSRARASVIARFNSDIYASNLAGVINRATHS